MEAGESQVEEGSRQAEKEESKDKEVERKRVIEAMSIPPLFLHPQRSLAPQNLHSPNEGPRHGVAGGEGAASRDHSISIIHVPGDAGSRDPPSLHALGLGESTKEANWGEEAKRNLPGTSGKRWRRETSLERMRKGRKAAMRAAETHCERAGAALGSSGLWATAKAQLCVQLKQKHPIITPTTATLQPTPPAACWGPGPHPCCFPSSKPSPS